MTTISLLLHYYLYVLLDSKALNESVKITELDGFTSFLLLRILIIHFYFTNIRFTKVDPVTCLAIT